MYTYDGIGSHERTGYSCEVRSRMPIHVVPRSLSVWAPSTQVAAILAEAVMCLMSSICRAAQIC